MCGIHAVSLNMFRHLVCIYHEHLRMVSDLHLTCIRYASDLVQILKRDPLIGHVGAIGGLSDGCQMGTSCVSDGC